MVIVGCPRNSIETAVANVAEGVKSYTSPRCQSPCVGDLNVPLWSIPLTRKCSIEKWATPHRGRRRHRAAVLKQGHACA